jgi:hypothetical protein
MKTNRVELYKWLPSEGESIEIDWPKVHKKIGLDQTRWIIDQPLDRCQMVLERRDQYCSLIVEFFDEKIAAEYVLRWR